MSLSVSPVLGDILYGGGDVLAEPDDVLPVVRHAVAEVHEVVEIHRVVLGLTHGEPHSLTLAKPQSQLHVLRRDLELSCQGI